MSNEKSYNVTAYEAETGKEVFRWIDVAHADRFQVGDSLADTSTPQHLRIAVKAVNGTTS
jgi:hypothetical protein